MHVCYADRLFVSVYRQNVTSMQRHTDSQTERERERERQLSHFNVTQHYLVTQATMTCISAGQLGRPAAD